MKLKILLSLLICLVIAVVLSSYTKKARRTAAESGFVFVELFTSEGCSSCPAAEQLVEKILRENRDKRVYIASYHVDYWDRLGWKDQFSKRDYSLYQYQYAKQFHLKSVYTPQIVVNGQTEFVGSNEIALRSAISSNMNNRENTHISLSQVEVSGGKCNFHYTLNNAENTSGLTIVLMQKKALVSVKGGENNGRLITHVNVVRETKDIPATRPEGNFSLTIPADLGTDNWEVLCYTKSNTTGQILSIQRVL